MTHPNSSFISKLRHAYIFSDLVKSLEPRSSEAFKHQIPIDTIPSKICAFILSGPVFHCKMRLYRTSLPHRGIVTVQALKKLQNAQNNWELIAIKLQTLFYVCHICSPTGPCQMMIVVSSHALGHPEGRVILLHQVTRQSHTFSNDSYQSILVQGAKLGPYSLYNRPASASSSMCSTGKNFHLESVFTSLPWSNF